MMLLQQNDIVLFQGDSITDGGRTYGTDAPLGWGYPLLLASKLGYQYPNLNLTFLNRGISGDRVVDLQQRWDKDCLDLGPTWVSIYIGINDTWRKYDSGDATSAAQFKSRYSDIIGRTQEKLHANLILIEPFVLPVPEDRNSWREDLDPKIGVVRDFARGLYVPLDGLFAAASTLTEPAYWAPDGVHPSPAGHELIANAWLKAVGAAL
jgi:acyl-CoA thioesterase-1